MFKLKEDHKENRSSFEDFSSQVFEKQNDASETATSILAQQAITNLEEFGSNLKPIGRQEEAKAIRQFVINGIEMGGSSQTLYIAGIPGIGKTLTVTSVIQDIKENDQYGKKFKSFYLNAMAYKHPTKIYKSLLHRIFKETGISKSKEIARLDYLLTTPSQTKAKVIVIDQLDYLVTKDQSVLYNLFEWAQNPNSKLILITISNTLNLPQMLKQKIYSRMGDTKIAFSSYNKEQIQKIIEQRLKETKTIFSEQAMRYACTKIAGVSCDIRKALFLLRQSLQIFVQASYSQIVQIDHIRQAFQNIFAKNPQSEYIRLMPNMFQLVLIYVALDQSQSESRKCLLSSIASRLHASYKQISYECVQRILMDLKQVGIITLQQQIVNHTMNKVIKLAVSNDQIKNSIKSQQFQTLLQILQ